MYAVSFQRNLDNPTTIGLGRSTFNDKTFVRARGVAITYESINNSTQGPKMVDW